MDNVYAKALEKIVNILDTENIDYMIVGGFAVSFHNRARTTNDIDIVLQIYPKHVTNILKHFPDWKGFEESFMEDVANGFMFNLTDFDTGIRYDFMVLKNDDYAWQAFERRKQVRFFDTKCYICAKEDLIIAKLQWYNITPSDKQLEDLKFLLLDKNLSMEYLKWWVFKLKLDTHGLLEK